MPLLFTFSLILVITHNCPLCPFAYQWSEVRLPRRGSSWLQTSVGRPEFLRLNLVIFVLIFWEGEDAMSELIILMRCRER